MIENRSSAENANVRSSRSGAESGRIGLLLVACMGVVACFVLISAGVTAVAVQDRRLIACADRIAASSAGVIDGGSYYTSDSGKIELSDEGIREQARSSLDSMSDSSCSVGTGVDLVAAGLEEDEVWVTVSARATIPGLPQVFSLIDPPILTRTSTAIVR